MISAIIPVYADAKKHTHVNFSLPLCLKPLVNHEKIKEIILVDDGSPTQPDFIFHPKTHGIFTLHKGIGHARNLGIKIAKEPYVLILDSDIILNKEILDRMITIFENDKEYYYSFVCVSHVKNYLPSLWTLCESQYWQNNEDKPGKNWLSCGCMLCRKEAFDQLQFKNGDEDTQFSRDRLNFKLHAYTLNVYPHHVFCVSLKALTRKWRDGAKRAKESKSVSNLHVLRSIFAMIPLGVKLAFKYKNLALIPFMVFRTLNYARGFYS
jgi:glycosyltransferase involved in cell wall biosynthesis